MDNQWAAGEGKREAASRGPAPAVPAPPPPSLRVSFVGPLLGCFDSGSGPSHALACFCGACMEVTSLSKTTFLSVKRGHAACPLHHHHPLKYDSLNPSP